jgi:hypothetical protein
VLGPLSGDSTKPGPLDPGLYVFKVHPSFPEQYQFWCSDFGGSGIGFTTVSNLHHASKGAC